jgi:hypothetical protein
MEHAEGCGRGGEEHPARDAGVSSCRQGMLRGDENKRSSVKRADLICSLSSAVVAPLLDHVADSLSLPYKSRRSIHVLSHMH